MKTLVPRRARRLLPALVLLLLGGCGGLAIEQHAVAQPRFDPLEFFDGALEAHGLVQDWRGRVTRRFVVALQGRRNGDEVVLEEDFRYDDGERAERTWHIVRTAEGQWEGRAEDIVGVARGETAGNAMRWRYDMDVTVDGATWRISFDDWLWLIDEHHLVNRSRLRKFGLDVGEVTLSMRRL